MKLGTIIQNGKETVIARVDDEQAVALDATSMLELIEGGDAALDKANVGIPLFLSNAPTRVESNPPEKRRIALWSCGDNFAASKIASLLVVICGITVQCLPDGNRHNLNFRSLE